MALSRRRTLLAALGAGALAASTLFQRPGSDFHGAFVGLAPLASTPRGERAATQLRARYDRTRALGGGRLSISMNRKPVFGYALADVSNSDKTEPAGRVVNRMWDMIDLDYTLMIQTRQRYQQADHMLAKWTADWKMRAGRKRKAFRLKRQFEEEWQQWMRTEGRMMGLTKPIVYNGPIVNMEADDEFKTVAEWRKATTAETIQEAKLKGVGKHARDMIPIDCLPGQWVDGEESIFKIWKRPLHKYPYDIGTRGTTRVVHSNVY